MDLCVNLAPPDDERPWRTDIRSLNWLRHDYRSDFSLEKPRHEETSGECELMFAAANQRSLDEFNLYLTRLLGMESMLAATKPSKSKKQVVSEPVDDFAEVPPMTQDEWDQCLKHLCCPSAADAVRWSEFAKVPRTNAEIMDRLATLWEKPVTVDSGRLAGYAVTSVAIGHPLVWMDQTHDKGTPALSGDELADAVRGLWKIKNADSPALEGIEKPSGKKSKASKQVETETHEQPANPFVDDEPAELGPIVRYAVELMTRSPYQTRQDDPAQIDDLAESMRTEGQLDPILVRPNGELVGGHTRWQAAQKLGWKELDARIVTCSDATARRLVLIHNAKRKDLTERERVKSYLDLLEDYKSRGQSQEELARRLGIKGPTLSNILRLRAIPEGIWERFEKGWLSIDQLRALATHAARQKFVDGVLKHLESVEGQPEPNHFRSAMQAGIDRCFRPMTPPVYRGGPGRLFKPNKIESELLEIVEVESPWGHGKEKMAANVDEWNRLQKAAKAAAKSEQIATPSDDPSKMKAAERASRELRLQKRKIALDHAWHLARCAAIGQKFEKPKKQDHLAAMRLQILISQESGAYGEFHFDAHDLTVDDTQFMKTVCEDVLAFFTTDSRDDIAADEVKSLCEWMNLVPQNHWKATEELLTTCTSEELQQIADDFDLPEDQTANDLIDVLVGQWPPGLIPPLFRPELSAKPKKK